MIGWMTRFVFRSRVLATRFVFDRIISFMVRDEDWREQMLLDRLAVVAGRRLLGVGPYSFSSTLLTALQHPETSFCAVETRRRTAKFERVARGKGAANIRFVRAPTETNLPFENDEFDAVVSAFAFHDRQPSQKLAIATELSRILRPGGDLFVIDLDQPQSSQEMRVLRAGSQIWGTNAILPHFNGSWIGVFSEAKFVGTRRERSLSLRLARISVISAKKPVDRPKSVKPARRPKGRPP